MRLAVLWRVSDSTVIAGKKNLLTSPWFLVFLASALILRSISKIQNDLHPKDSAASVRDLNDAETQTHEN